MIRGLRKALFFLSLTIPVSLSAQRAMTLEEAIGTARSQSVAALQAKHAFVSTYWAYRSYQASRLPSLNLYGNLMNFDRSLTLLQSYEDGTFRYANSYNLQNSLGLSVAQNVTFTGGR
ncbi:MAG: TolC family protein, partial [Bacteroidales bacterium]|nr:TolC family protein [Bacteroidales bacterium]